MPPAKSPQLTPQPTPAVLAGRTLRMMRQAHKVTIREMAERVGISASHLSRVESGERPATAELTARICDEIATLPAPKVPA